MILVLDRTALTVVLENDTIRVNYKDGSFQRVPLRLLVQVVVRGSVQIDTHVLSRLAVYRVPFVAIPARGTSSASWSSPGLGGSVATRLEQYQVYLDTATRLGMAKYLLCEKIKAYARVFSDLFPQQKNTVICYAMEKTISHAESFDVLMGIEGGFAKSWFAHMQNEIDPIWGFTGRNRRPPRDPVNSLLSLTYTLIGSIVNDRVIVTGLDPSLGFLHEIRSSRPSLVLDLLEPLRCLGDWFVLELVKNDFSQDDFSCSELDGCKLKKSARSIFYTRWYSFVAGKLHVGNGVSAENNDNDSSIENVITLSNAIDASIKGLRGKLKI